LTKYKIYNIIHLNNDRAVHLKGGYPDCFRYSHSGIATGGNMENLKTYIISKSEEYSKSFRLRKISHYLYFLIQDTNIIYIGRTKNIEWRLLSHYNNNIIKFNKYYYLEYDNFMQLFYIEKEYINKINPIYNKTNYKI
jgi:predicted GIY-YIG superfamily endonuclease